MNDQELEVERLGVKLRMDELDSQIQHLMNRKAAMLSYEKQLYAETEVTTTQEEQKAETKSAQKPTPAEIDKKK